MVRQLWCRGCGHTRTLDTARRHRSGHAPMTCLCCGSTVFTADPSTAPSPRGWALTAYDRLLLRTLRIATGDAFVGSRREQP